MITNEMLTADAVLSTLTDEQRAAIVLMSKNDEEVTIGQRFSEVYNRMDATIAEATGIARNGDEKTYNYLARAAKQLAEKANSVDGLNDRIATLTKERDKLQKALADGGDETTKRQLAQAIKDLDGVRAQYDTLKAEYDKAKSDHAAELLGVRIDNELAGASAGLKFKAEFPQAAVDTLVRQAVSTVKGMSPEYVDDGKGGQRLVFRNAAGETMRNPENHQEPYTAAELVAKELKAMGILDEGRKVEGAGTRQPSGGGGGKGGSLVDVSAARTQSEATDLIARQLMSDGLIKGSAEYQDAFDAAWTANGVSELPMQ